MNLQGVDPTLVEAWVKGWALAREKSPPRTIEGGWRIEVNEPDQKARCVFADAGEHLAAVATRIAEPLVVLKVLAPPEAAEPHLPNGWRITRTTWMMTGANARRRIDWPVTYEELGAVTRAALSCEGVGDAAIGRIAVTDGWAIYNRIATHPDFRRRGLGSALMRALGAAAAEQGVTRGVLVATPEGRALYESLGWRVASLYTTIERVG